MGKTSGAQAFKTKPLCFFSNLNKKIWTQKMWIVRLTQHSNEIPTSVRFGAVKIRPLYCQKLKSENPTGGIQSTESPKGS